LALWWCLQSSLVVGAEFALVAEPLPVALPRRFVQPQAFGRPQPPHPCRAAAKPCSPLAQIQRSTVGSIIAALVAPLSFAKLEFRSPGSPGSPFTFLSLSLVWLCCSLSLSRSLVPSSPNSGPGCSALAVRPKPFTCLPRSLSLSLSLVHHAPLWPLAFTRNPLTLLSLPSAVHFLFGFSSALFRHGCPYLSSGIRALTLAALLRQGIASRSRTDPIGARGGGACSIKQASASMERRRGLVRLDSGEEIFG
jgi:hypothetical protein